MYKFAIFALCAVIMATAPGCSCTTIEPGYVGIKVNMYGGDKGVDNEVLDSGRVWYNAITENIYVFPVFMQNATWVGEEALTFNSVEGSPITADLACSYSLSPEKIPIIFQELRKDADYITSVYVRSKVRDALNRHAGKMKAIEILGEKKEELLKKAKDSLQEELGPKGFVFDMISFNGEVVVDARVKDSINKTIEAAQKAIEAENKVRESKALAEQKIEEARGRAESRLLEAEAEATANRKIAESITPVLMQYQAIEKWDGVLPRFTGGDAPIPFIQVPLGEQPK